MFGARIWILGLMPILTHPCPKCARRAADVLRVEQSSAYCRITHLDLVCRHCVNQWTVTEWLDDESLNEDDELRRTTRHRPESRWWG